MKYDPHGEIQIMRLEKKKFSYDYQPRKEWESKTNKETWEEVKEARRKLREEREILTGQKRGTEDIIDVMEVDEGEQDHPAKKKIVEELQEEEENLPIDLMQIITPLVY